MADEMSMALAESLHKAQVSEDVDFLREGLCALAEALMEVEVTRHIGVGRYQRTPQRTNDETRENRRASPFGCRGRLTRASATSPVARSPQPPTVPHARY